MSLNRPVAQCPLLLQSDMVRLHHTLQINNTTVVDAVLGVTHQALPTAVPLLQLLKRGTTYRELLLTAHRNGCSTAQLRELLGFLQISGGIERYRQLHTWPEAILYSARSICIGIQTPSVAHRYKAAPVSLLLSVLSATQTISFSCLLATTVLCWLQQWDIRLAMCVCAYALCLFVSSIYMHEAGHLMMLRNYKIPAIIVRQRLRIGILHRRLDHQKELRTSFAGPVVGVLMCLTAAIACFGFGEHLLAGISVLIGLIHLCGLLPWYGDGRSIRAARLEKRKVYV